MCWLKHTCISFVVLARHTCNSWLESNLPWLSCDFLVSVFELLYELWFDSTFSLITFLSIFIFLFLYITNFFFSCYIFLRGPACHGRWKERKGESSPTVKVATTCLHETDADPILSHLILDQEVAWCLIIATKPWFSIEMILKKKWLSIYIC